MNNEKKVYIVLSYSGSVPARIVRFFSGAPYSHSSISLCKNLSELYSFGRRRMSNPLIGGFVIEAPGKGIFEKFPTSVCRVLELSVDEKIYENLKIELETFVRRKQAYRYAFLGAALAYFGVEFRYRNHYYCSEFVKEVLLDSGMDVSCLPKICYPCDFQKLPGIREVYAGRVNDYLPADRPC